MTSWNNTENISSCKLNNSAIIEIRQDRLSYNCVYSESHFNIFPINSAEFVSKSVTENNSSLFQEIASRKEDRGFVVVDLLNNTFTMYTNRTRHEFNFDPDPFYPFGIFS